MLAPSTRKFWTTDLTARKIAIVSRTVWTISQMSERADSPRDSLGTGGTIICSVGSAVLAAGGADAPHADAGVTRLPSMPAVSLADVAARAAGRDPRARKLS